MSDSAGPMLKLAACCCISMILITASIMMANYWRLYNVATAYNLTAVDAKHSYDQCGLEY